MASDDTRSGWVRRISVAYSFSASHQLDGLPDAHKCSRLHGHTYSVDVVLEGSVDEVGFVVDFAEMAWFGDLVAERLDHRHLNDVLPLNPTSENIAGWLGSHVAEWVSRRDDQHRFTGLGVSVSESPRTSASMWVAR